ncbi:MAG TPA: Ig-like domain-containing protein [Coriobacteriia bacterium]|nr:Ig-like domain-containing protein [Coriobacteriia bacterium]
MKVSLLATFATLLVASIIPVSAYATTAGPEYGTGSDGGGALAWTAATSVNANDNSNATRALNQNQTSNTLFAKNLGFAIPTDATITGIQVTVGRYTSGMSTPLIRDFAVQLTKDGSALAGTNKAATTTDWPTSEGAATYGATNDLWGQTWTPAEINAATFGVGLQARNTNANARTATVDYININVSYSLPGGPNVATSGANDASAGTTAWTNPGNVAGDDGTYATSNVGTNSTSQYLNATGFGFNIPAGANINGITVAVDRMSSGTTAPFARDHTIQLLNGGSRAGDNKAATGTNWPTGGTAIATYGSASDSWGRQWTPAEINASDFGVSLRVSNTNGSNARVASVDYVEVTVDWDLNPACTINQASGQADPTNSKTIYYDLVFTRAVTGLDVSDFVLTGSPTGWTATGLEDTSAGAGTAFRLTVTGGIAAGEGTVVANLPAASCNAVSGGQANKPAISTDNFVTYDGTQPTVTVNQNSGQADPTNSKPVYFDVAFSEPVTGLTGDDFVVEGTATGFDDIQVTGSGAIYQVSVSGASAADGWLALELPEDKVVDAAGNTNTAWGASDNVVTYDVTAPVTTAVADPAMPDGADGWYITAPPITLDSDANVDVLYKWDDAATYTSYTAFPLITAPEGEHTLHFRGVDSAGNTEADKTAAYKVDTVHPTGSVEQASYQTDPTNASSIDFDVVFSEDVTGVETEDFAVGGTATGFEVTGVTGSGSVYLVTVSVPNGIDATDGTVTLALGAGNVLDVAGNLNDAATSTDAEVTFDGTRPTVTVDQAASQDDPTNVASVDFDVTFSEDVTGLNSADFGSQGTASGFDTINVSGSGKDYVVTVSGAAPGDGTVVLSIRDDAAFDAAGNGNGSPDYQDTVVTYDITAPATTHQTDISSNGYDWFKSAPQITLTTDELVDVIYYHWDSDADAEYSGAITAPEGTHTLHVHAVDVAGNVAGDTAWDFHVDTVAPTGSIQINGGATVAPARGASLFFTMSDADSQVELMRLSDDGTTWGAWQSPETPYDYMLTAGDGVKTVYVQFKDHADNVSSEYSDSIILDEESPSVTVERAAGQASLTNAKPITFDVAFSEPVTGLTGDDFVVSGTAAGFDDVQVTGSGTTYVATVTGASTTDGTVILSLPAATVLDTNNNDNTESTSVDNTVTYDGTKPTATLEQGAAQADPTNEKTIKFDLAFSEDVSPLVTDDFSLGGSATGFSVTDVTGSGDTFEVTVTGSGAATDGTVTLILPTDEVTDAAGNGNEQSTSTDNSVTYDGSATAPTGLKVTSFSNSVVGIGWTAATDPHGPVSYKVWTDGVAPVTTTGTSKTFTGLSANTSYTLHVQTKDALGNLSAEATIVQKTAAASSSAPIGGTGAQSVTLPTSQGNATVTFANVTTPGTLFLTPVASPSADAFGATWVQIGDMSYEVTFTGTFTGNVTITLPYSPLLPDARAKTAVIRHYGASGWETITPTVNTSAGTITFTLTSLSPIVVAEPKGANWALGFTTNFVGSAASVTQVSPAYGASVTLSGALAAADGSAVGHKVVTLQKLSGSAWVDVVAAAEGAKGIYSATTSAADKTAYRLYAAADAFTPAAAGATYTVYPQVKPAITKMVKSIKKSKTFTIKGNVTPKHAKGTKVTLQFSQYSKSKKRYVYKYARTVKLTSTSAFSYKTKIKKTGKWQVRIYAKADALHAKSYSAHKKITVK